MGSRHFPQTALLPTIPSPVARRGNEKLLSTPYRVRFHTSSSRHTCTVVRMRTMHGCMAGIAAQVTPNASIRRRNTPSRSGVARHRPFGGGDLQWCVTGVSYIVDGRYRKAALQRVVATLL
jgi:hypothetical protein